MIQMRWLERTIIVMESAGLPHKSIERALQYKVYQQGIIVTPDGEKPVNGWSEWMDVPIECDEFGLK